MAKTVSTPLLPAFTLAIPKPHVKDGGTATSSYADQVKPANDTANRSVQAAHDHKVAATSDWVSGRISSKEHSEIHKRADYVIKEKGRNVNAVGSKGGSSAHNIGTNKNAAALGHAKLVARADKAGKLAPRANAQGTKTKASRK